MRGQQNVKIWTVSRFIVSECSIQASRNNSYEKASRISY